ncbi:PTS sugar transporter subunit IIA [Ligilactobacillus animalis]|uniref:PTS sugar transporter subunit IIA n=1 Tax=Ligilactobacillus animalis TaxID=1605 RepID=UPI0002194B8B|nr:PTS sugar transporter subunit IIA [Ligilactobacillus animalis]KRM58937.1 mannose PTS, EIIA [Ligilactobacillus animalis KCTC 3501 = DSM 20602]
MLGLIVASHGNLAQELIKSSYLILGQQEKVIAVTFEPAEDLATLEDKYETSLQQFATTDRVLFLCDLYGGNPLLATRRFVERDPKRLAAVGGVNLAMLLEACTLRTEALSLDELAEKLISVGRQGIGSVKDLGTMPWM